MNATVKQVFPEPRKWNKPEFPDACSVGGLFQDGSRFELNTKIAKAPEHIEALTALIGKPGEFDCEPKPDYDGCKQWKMKSYPGKPQKQFGGREYVPAWHQTEQGARFHEERTDRRCALMQAVEYAGQAKEPVAHTHTAILDWADWFYQWLRAVDVKS